MGDTMTVCSGCRTATSPSLGAAMADRLRSRLAALDVKVRLTDCMIVCGDPVSVSFRAKGKAAYLFSGVDPETFDDALVTFATLYKAAPDGIVDDVRPCGELRFKLIGRIPA